MILALDNIMVEHVLPQAFVGAGSALRRVMQEALREPGASLLGCALQGAVEDVLHGAVSRD